MYEYKIIKSELGWILSRKKEMWKLIHLQYLYWKNKRWPNKWLAKTFYVRESAISALIIMRKNEWKESD